MKPEKRCPSTSSLDTIEEPLFPCFATPMNTGRRNVAYDYMPTCNGSRTQTLGPLAIVKDLEVLMSDVYGDFIETVEHVFRGLAAGSIASAVPDQLVFLCVTCFEVTRVTLIRTNTHVPS
ncbi:SAG-related sequence SRS49A [Toxoplasma gondii FOU]|uniref:SAG-related sequence SRS49A n=2 Tax=Toxoplasma gondii TaxID=5811 RepID=A0A086JJH0_TOXGO|nr:SAG-related sequence SRS49A [Toxoplasma gondii FOU]PUA83414.1 hypothetical protein TGBR9_385130 [Toxoplasma gondii TgCATBr9]